MGSISDIAVLGSGPAALSIASEASARGASILVIAPEPRALWKPNYCLWADEVPEHILPLAERVWPRAAVETGLGQRLLDRPYAKLDNDALQSFYWSELARGSIRVVAEPAERLEHLEEEARVHTASGAVERARVVIDASGARTPFVRRVHRRPPAFQTAYGLWLDAPDHPFDPEQVVMMDFRPIAEEESEPPSFLYVLPFPDGRLFIEETSLSRRPAMAMEPLRARLQLRLAALGLDRAPRLGEELCAIPMGLGLPTPGQRVVPFGAAAAMMHPASGYHMFHALRKAPRVAQAIVGALETDSIEHAVSAGNAAVWPRSHRRLWELYQFGLETLLEMSGDEISRFFSAFFELPEPAWSGYLGATLEPGELARAMTGLFRSLPATVQWHLVRTGLSAGAAPLARSLFAPRNP